MFKEKGKELNENIPSRVDVKEMSLRSLEGKASICEGSGGGGSLAGPP